MKLDSVEIFGFKSFPQRTEISFNRGITGIVGPNGSGKSNIADAVRWVLGEQSARTLRGTRMEDVIFSGTEKRKPLPYCEVSLDFDNVDRSLDTDYSHVRITRRAYRNGDSEYLLNKTACRLKDVVQLFRDTGIGKEGYSIIGQGRIEEILSTRGEERRRVFEEAAGIATFRERKEEAERKLQKTREHLFRVGDILQEIETGIETLHDHATKAQRFLQLSETLRSLDANIYLEKRSKLEDRLQTTKKQSLRATESIEALDQRIQDLLEEGTASERLRSSLDSETRLVRDRLDGLRAAHAKAQSEAERAQMRLEAAERELETLGQQTVEAEERLAVLKGDTARADNAGLVGFKALEEADAQGGTLTAELNALLSKEASLSASLDEHRDRILAVMNQLSDAKSGHARQQAMKAQMEARIRELTDEADVQATENHRLAEALITAAGSREKSETQLQEDDAALALCESALNEAAQILALKSEETMACSRRLEQSTSRHGVLAELSSEHEGYFNAVRQAIAFASGNPDVFGVVARLITVPKNYETAIEMVLGHALQDIVTRDEDVAKDLIRHLRINRLGRATFLPLTAVRPRRLNTAERKLLSMEGCIGVASELIGCDEKLRPVVEHLLGRTVIVSDLDAGIALSRAAGQAFHAVTLEGDILRAGGAITGGEARRTSVSLLGREREIVELKATIAADTEALSVLQKEQRTLSGRLNALEEQRNLFLEQVQQQRIAVERDRAKNNVAQSELADGERRLARLMDAADQLSQSLDVLTADLHVSQQEARMEADQLDTLKSATQRLQNDLAEARTGLDSQREKLTALQLHRSKLAHEAEVLARDAAKGRQEILKMEAVLAKNKKRRTEIKESLTEAEELRRTHCKSAEESTLAIDREERRLWAMEEAGRKAIREQQEKTRETEKTHALRNTEAERLRRSEVNTARIEAEIHTIAESILSSHELSHEAALRLRVPKPVPLESAQLEAAELRAAIRDLGSVHLGAIEEYLKTKERYEDLLAQRDDTSKAEKDLVALIDRLLATMEQQFLEGLAQLNEYFGETFSRLFGGGQARLRLADEGAPLSCDIEIVAQPLGKKLQLLSLLSSGERALTAIAILFAMLKLKPTPFCVLDEIEAALDEANIGYFADYLAEFAKSTQFIVITHRKGTMQRCDALYGVSMEEKGISSMVSVDLKKFGS